MNIATDDRKDHQRVGSNGNPPSPSRLTQPQAALLHVIQTFWQEHGYPPAHRQLARLMGKQHRAIQEVLERLVRKGYVTYDRGVSRSLRLTRLGRIRPLSLVFVSDVSGATSKEENLYRPRKAVLTTEV